MNILDAIIYPVVDLMEGTLPPAHEFNKDPQTILFGLDAPLDSIALLTFITGIEEQARTVTGRDIRLLTPETMALDESPFQSLGTLATYLDEVLKRDSHASTPGSL